MKFRQWVAFKGGPRVVASLLGIRAHTVRAWLRREASPRAVTMRRIVALARGEVTYADIINETKGLERVR